MTRRAKVAILFDFDGVLAETMLDHFQAWALALKDFGVKLTAENYYPFEGLAMDKLALKYCLENHVPEGESKKIIENKEKYYLANYHFRLYSGVSELIEELYGKKIPIAIVTTGLKARLLKSTPLNFLNKFSTIVTGDDVDRGKPFPDPYLKASRDLGVDIRDCVVVENSPMGVESAKSAGAYCIGILSTLGAGHLAGADQVVSSFSELKNVKVIQEILAQ